MSLLKTATEGGQIWAHHMRMTKQVIKSVFLVSLLASILYFAYQMSHIPTHRYQAIGYYFKVLYHDGINEKVTVSATFLEHAEYRYLPHNNTSIPTTKLKKLCLVQLQLLTQETLQNAKKTTVIFLLLFTAFAIYFLARGLRARRKEAVSGQEISPAWKIALQLTITRKASPIKISTLPLIKGTETRHILVSGGTGSGKTNCFHTLLPQIRAQRQRAVIVDSTGEFVSRYYREGKDILMNPFDKRSPPWSPWCECLDTFDYKALVQSFIPSSFREDENFWRRAAQEVFYAILYIQQLERRTSAVTRLLFYTPLHILHDALRDTKAAPFIDPSSEKTAASIRAVAASFLECLELFEDTDTPFSIREWVAKENDDSWIFFTSTVGQRAALLPILSAWFSIAMRSLLLLKPNLKRRLWFIADELPTLSRLRDLETCLTESRKFGGCGLFAIQSPAQIEMIYGKDLARVIIGNCATRIAFTEKDPEIAERISRTFGTKELKELQEGISYGAHEMRDGVNLSIHTKTTPVVSMNDLQTLDTNEAFVRLAGNFPATRLKFHYREIPPISTPFERK
jgi:type IV conjugative transfer system coupling protein TraD